ncbi:MAG: molecular chaperone TorD family protein [Actinobacteria bacterium]|nr:molecular chaperone TorD family protein [Actinomycetota bacterium]
MATAGTVGSRERADEAVARSAVYRLLSQAYAYPTVEAVRRLRRQDIPLARAVSGRLDHAVREGVESVAASFRGIPTHRLEAAYRDAFSHVHSVDCPPYETDYSAGEVFRQSRDLADLAGFYRAFGLQAARERTDHVTLELEFMHMASYKEAWAEARAETEHAEVCRSAQGAFLADHLGRWLGGFASRVEAVAARPYGAAARLTRVFLESEAGRFGLVPHEVLPEPSGLGDAEGVALCEPDP